MGQCIRIARPLIGTSVTDDQDRIIRLETTHNSATAPGHTVTYVRDFDPQGRVTTILSPSHDPARTDRDAFTVWYDDAEMSARQTDEAGRVRDLFSDRVGRAVWTREWLGSPIIAGEYVSARTRYDEAGNIISVADPLDQKSAPV